MASSFTPPAAFTDSSSMLSGLTGDIFAGIADIPADAPQEDASAESEPEPVEEPAGEEPIEAGTESDDEPVTEPAEPADAEPAEPVAQAQPDELPEGVTRGKDSKGREKFFLEPNRYKTVYGNHQLVQQLTDTIGEPLTAESLDVRNRAFIAQEKLFGDLSSGDPHVQGNVVDFLIGEMNGAREAGETGVDPTVPFAETVYTKLRDTAPEGYANLRYMAARDLIGEMFHEAAAANDNHLFAAAQQFARKLINVGPKPEGMDGASYLNQVRQAAETAGIPFYSPQEMQEVNTAPDPVYHLQQRVRELEAQQTQRSTSSAAQQFDEWNRSHTQAVNQSVDNEAVMPSLETAAEAWKQFPDDYTKRVVTPLKAEVAKIVRGDTALNQRIGSLNDRIKRATSPEVREQLGEEVRNLVTNRAKLAAEKAKGPILKEAAEWLQFKSHSTHARHTAGQNRSAPRGTTSPVNRSLMPEMPAFKGGQFDSKTAVQQAAKLMAALNR